MGDVRDILGATKLPGEKPEAAPKPKKPKIERPKGMSREAFALLGDQHPIISSQLVDKGKKDLKAKPKPSTKGVVVWNFKGFRNSARNDGLELKRWTKAYKDAAGRVRDADDSNDYAFAKCNKKVYIMHACKLSSRPCCFCCCCPCLFIHTSYVLWHSLSGIAHAALTSCMPPILLFSLSNRFNWHGTTMRSTTHSFAHCHPHMIGAERKLTTYCPCVTDLTCASWSLQTDTW